MDPHISNYILPYLNNNNNIILFDEGHNIDDILCENHSITITMNELEESDRKLTKCFLSHSITPRMSEKLQSCQDAQRQQIENVFLTLQQGVSRTDLRRLFRAC